MAGETMQGRRLPDVQVGVPSPGWDEWAVGTAAPGSYMRVDMDWSPNHVARPPMWWIVDPAGKAGALRTHTVTEHDDGTITVSPSILAVGPDGWHGFLERGVWRSC